MEKSVETHARIRIKSNALAAYDAVRHEPVAIQSSNGVVEFDTTLPGGGGQLIILLPEAVESVNVAVETNEIQRGEAFNFSAGACNSQGGVIEALLPLEVVISDSTGQRLPGSGYYAARAGKLAVEEFAAVNAAPGKVTVTVRCLASGKIGTAEFTVK